MIQTLEVRSSRRCQFIDVTDRLQQVVRAGGLRQGYAICYVPHTTAGITIQENADPAVTADLQARLEALVPRDLADYRHREGNSDAHIKASLLGFSQMVLVRDGRLELGTWQAIYFAEFDGPRTRRLHVKLVSG